MSYDADIERVRKNAEAQGFRYTRTAKNHHQFYAPNRKDIITAPGTPSDHRGWSNFLADMKRSGYIEANGGPISVPLGDLLAQKKPEQVPAAVPKKPHRGAIPGFLFLQLQAAGRTMHTDELRDAVAAKFGKAEAEGNHVASALWSMTKQGKAIRISMGLYAIAPGWTLVQAKPAVPAVAATPLADSTSQDERELDEALAALAKIEAVVRRHKATLGQLALLKKLLNGGT